MVSVAIVICWYGPYPWYFPYFLHSCLFNPTIDFIIITDNNEIPLSQPSNVKFINYSLQTINNLASKKFGFRTSLDHPYKLCDFKPAYGCLFDDLLSSYDFWGHGDLDIVFGSIRNFITDDILNKFDVISCRHDYVSGAFTLFRNTAKMNTLFRKSRDYVRVFSHSKNFCFDECSFLFKQLENGASIFDFPAHIQNMTWVVKNEEKKGSLRAFFDFIILEGTPSEIIWHNGCLYYKSMYEAMAYHLIKFKKLCKTKKVLDPLPNQFYFTQNDIRELSSSTNNMNAL